MVYYSCIGVKTSSPSRKRFRSSCQCCFQIAFGRPTVFSITDFGGRRYKFTR